jgi:hypothetical protein
MAALDRSLSLPLATLPQHIRAVIPSSPSRRRLPKKVPEYIAEIKRPPDGRPQRHVRGRAGNDAAEICG